MEYLKYEFAICQFFVRLECSVAWKVILSRTEMSVGLLMKRKS